MPLTGEMALNFLLDAVDRALSKYSSDNVDVVKNEETGFLDIIYHSRNNSFSIESGIVGMSRINKAALIRELDRRGVGHSW